MFFDGKEYSQMFLKNGCKLKMKMDAQQLMSQLYKQE